ncbi:MAG TPA: hypothetical protein VIM00_06945 [Candidatus Acidoferrum sp.]
MVPKRTRPISTVARCSLLMIALLFLITTLASAQSPAGNSTHDIGVETQMHNVTYHYSTTAAVNIRNLIGELIPVSPAEFPVFDDKDSFHLRIASAEIAVAAPDLANIFNTSVFTGQQSPLSDISMTIENGRLLMKGKLHEKAVIPFESEGFLSPTPDGKIFLRIGKVKALHLPVKGLMNLFNVEMADLIKNGKVPGIQASGDDLILDPAVVFPAPHLEGKVSAIRLEAGNLVLNFGAKNTPLKFHQAGNYMLFRDNRLRFGKLTMADVDLILIDMDPRDPFDFSLDHYKQQLSAGYTKITSKSGLRTFMKDFDKLSKSRAKSKN